MTPEAKTCCRYVRCNIKVLNLIMKNFHVWLIFYKKTNLSGKVLEQCRGSCRDNWRDFGGFQSIISEEFWGCPHKGRKSKWLDITSSKISLYFLQCLEGLKLICYSFPQSKLQNPTQNFARVNFSIVLAHSIVCLGLYKVKHFQRAKISFPWKI